MVVEELEMLPMMNLFVVLIPMLLLSAVFLEMSVIRMNLPGDDAPPPSPRETLGLSVTIADAAWVVSGRGLPAHEIARDGDGAPARLREALAAASAGHPDDKDVTIRSAETTRYEEIVLVMDASRESGFPNVSLAEAGR
jgi:biopolymer transport protein ExbD